MGRTSLSGPLRLGPDFNSATPNTGLAVISQTGTITQNSTTAVNLTFYVPANSQILFFFFDVLVVFDSATSATLSAGRTSGGTELASGVNVKAATGRIAPTLTATQLGNMADVTTNTTVVVTVTPVGATTTGSIRVTMVYVQK